MRYVCKCSTATCMEISLMQHRGIVYHADPVEFNSSTVQYPKETVATITCDETYYLDGPTDISCRDNGSWSHQYPVCIGKHP